MKQFTLTLSYEDRASYADLRESLRYISKYTTDYRGPREVLEDGDDAQVKNPDGDVIGKWAIDAATGGTCPTGEELKAEHDTASPEDRAKLDALPLVTESTEDTLTTEGGALPSYVPPTPAEWWAIAEAMAATVEGATASVEGGGAACPFVRLVLPDGRIILFGDVNTEWGGQVYANEEAESEADYLQNISVDTDIPTSEHDAAKIARAFRDAVTDVCMVGNPAILGRCGETGCICNPDGAK